MDPFDAPGQGDSGLQQDFDERRLHLLECIVKRALLKSEPFERWKRRQVIPKPGGKAGETTTRYDERQLTLCDAVHELGLAALDPGRESVREPLRQRTPTERHDQQRVWLMKDDRVTALGRALLARADHSRDDELFGWQRTGLD